ncbi:MAG TPA: hypothetical protein VFG30_01685 [Polyangiales bacterium]|nr:hypothetical protein [Polyangiales bacterium]
MKWISICTGVVASVATATYVALRMFEVSVVVGIAALGMFYALKSGRETGRVCSELMLICQLVLLGLLWPSLWTVLAALVLPAALLGVWQLITKRLKRWSTGYVGASALLAALSLLGQAVYLIRVGK